MKKGYLFFWNLSKPHKYPKGGSLMRTQKMRDYVVRGKKVFIGLEDSKRSWKLCVRSEKMIVHEVSMPTEYDGLIRYIRRSYPGCSVKLIYEAGFNGFWLHDLLEADGVDCIVTPPNKVTQEKDSRVKNDRIDARRLAKVLEEDDCKSCFVPERELREDRQISRTLIGVQKDLTRLQGRIRHFFHFHHLAPGAFKGESWKASDVKRLRSICLSPPLRFSLDIMLKELEVALECRRELRKQVRALSKKQRYQEAFASIVSQVGVGPLSAIRFVLEWGEDLTRFGTGRRFSSYLGLTGSEFSTAETVRRGHITKQGKAFVRAWMIQCAWVGYKRDPVLLEKYQKVFKQTRSTKMAIVAVARKMAVRLWHLVMFKERYQIGLLEEQSAPAA
ncbi:MAG: IS110 family RNA-guided transposase [Planctomycetota bacterium]|jgi:transposase